MKVLSLRRPSTLRPIGLLRGLQNSNSNSLETSTPSIHHHVTSPSPCVRSLSSAAPRQDKSRRIAIPRRKTAATFDVPHFTQNDVPPESVLAAMLSHPATPAYLSGMTAAQCHSLLSEYVTRTLLLKDPTRDFQQVFRELLQRGGKSSPAPRQSLAPEETADKTRALHATLHSIAGMLALGPPGPIYNLALHILHALCKLDYTPSVLTVTRIALMSRSIDQPQWAPAVERFERFIKSLTAYRPASSSKSKKAKGSNAGGAESTGIAEEEEASLRANAFTLKGLILVASNQARPKPSPEGHREALKYFEAAVGSSSSRSRSASSSPSTPFSFDWQILCMVEMGHCYAALGDHPKAHAAWKFAAEELDNADATALYATHALRHDDPAREALLLKAAVSESKLAVEELDRVYSDNRRDQQYNGEGEETKKQGEGKWDTLFRKVTRDEWEKLASPPATTGTR